MKEKKFSDFEIEEKTSGGAVFEQGVKQSKEHKACLLYTSDAADE